MSDLPDALRALVAREVLTSEQADAVLREVEGDGSEPSSRTARNALPEILGWVGAALIGSAVLNLVAWQWGEWPGSVRLAVLSATVLVLTGAAVVLTVGHGGRTDVNQLQRTQGARRLVGVLVALAALTTGLLVGLAMDLWWPEVPDGWSTAIAGFVALIAAGVAVWWVPGVLTTLAAAAASAWFAVAVVSAASTGLPQWLPPLLLALAGVLWLALAPRVLAVPALVEVLGLAFVIAVLTPGALTPLGDSVSADNTVTAWLCRGLLLALSLTALTLFARGARWPWAPGGTVAGVIAALAVGGEALGWIAGLFSAGVALVVISGILLMLRRRYIRSGAVTPHSASPLART